jgi:hypothetical protein
MRPFETAPLHLTFGMRHDALGERAIATRLGKAGLPARTVAEKWEVSDRDDVPTIIADGSYRGQTL